MKSLRTRLLWLWLMLVAAGTAIGFVLLDSYGQTAEARVGRADELMNRVCGDLAGSLQFVLAGWNGAAPDARTAADLRAAVTQALAAAPGVEGGAWLAGAGPIAYAFPSYEGSGPKTDVPAAELESIRRLNEEAARTARPAASRQSGRSQVLLIGACPVQATPPTVTAWTMTRVGISEGSAYNKLLLGLSLVAVTVVGSAVWLAVVIRDWSLRLDRLEAALGRRDRDADKLPSLQRTGAPELDRLVDALNQAGDDLARERSRASASERLAAIGQLSAGLAHEIRNPLAAMRLKAENALASDDRHRTVAALGTIVSQIDRMDDLLSRLLQITPGGALDTRCVRVAAFVEEVVALYRDDAAARGLRLLVAHDGQSDASLRLDVGRMHLALGNLVLNALQNTPAGGTIAVRSTRHGDCLVLRVEDDGPGVPPALRDRLFEPFVTGRTLGTGLGLSMVREVARAHGGAARLASSQRGALFELEVPWQPC